MVLAIVNSVPFEMRRASEPVIVTKKSLPRRTFLRGMGAVMGLPLLDSMLPALSAATRTVIPRVVFVYTANGIIMKDWTPRARRRRF